MLYDDRRAAGANHQHFVDCLVVQVDADDGVRAERLCLFGHLRQRGLARDPELSGRFMLEFTIGSDGRVTDARLPTNELGEDVGTCIVGAVRRWRFDAPDGGEVTVRRPYILASGG